MPTDRGISVAEVARQLGVSDNCLRNWRGWQHKHNPSQSDQTVWSTRLSCWTRANGY